MLIDPQLIMAAPWIALGILHVIWSFQDQDPVFPELAVIIMLAFVAGLFGVFLISVPTIFVIIISLLANGTVMWLCYTFAEDEEGGE